MPPRNMSDSKRHRHDGQTKRQRHANKATPNNRKCTCQSKPECTKTFDCQFSEYNDLSRLIIHNERISTALVTLAKPTFINN